MAIIIPSKYIYDIDDNKVIDNEVDNLKVGAVNAQETQDFNVVVYEEEFDTSTNTQSIHNEKTDKGDTFYVTGAGGQGITYVRLACFAQTDITYKTIPEIKINKNQKNKLVKSIYTKADKNGNPDIKYNLKAKLEEYYGNIATYVPNTDTFTISDYVSPQNETNAYSYKNINYEETNKQIISTSTTNVTADLSVTVEDNTITTHSHIEGRDNAWNSSSRQYATADLSNNVNEILVFDNIEETEDYYLIKNLKVCVSVIDKLAYFYGESKESFDNITGGYSTYGVKLYINPMSLEISIYGDTITLDLQDETFKIGDENGQHIYSFSGNELMQTTNTDSVNNIYQKVVDSWRDGKEVATLRCAITDYETGEPITTTVTRVAYSSHIYVAIADNRDLQKGDVFYFSNGARAVVRNRVLPPKTQEYVWELNITTFPMPDIPLQVGESETITVTNRTRSAYRNVFKWGDIVEPYVYGADGRDKPMAVKKDGTAKQFKVISVGINNNSGITQDIVIQKI